MPEGYLPLSREKLRVLRSLISRKNRDRKGLCLVEGEKAINEAFKAGAVRYLVVEESKSDTVSSAIREISTELIFSLGPGEFMEISDVAQSKGIIGVASVPGQADIPITGKRDSGNLYLYLDAIQDPANVGALIRSAWALGFSGALLGPETADPFGARSIRASAGGIFHLPVREGVTVEDLTGFLDSGYSLYLADSGGASCEDVSFDPDSILALGNESRGLSPGIKTLGTKVSVPMKEGVDSLNVVMAGSIIASRMVP